MILALEYIKILAWVVVSIYAIIKREGLPSEKLILTLLSSFLMIYATTLDIMSGAYIEKTLVWLPANVLIVVTFIVSIHKYYSFWEDTNNRINRISKGLDTLSETFPVSKREQSEQQKQQENVRTTSTEKIDNR